jgi:hypothetical protein
MEFMIQLLRFELSRFRSAPHINVNSLQYSVIHWVKCSNAPTVARQLAKQHRDFPSFSDFVAYFIRIL